MKEINENIKKDKNSNKEQNINLDENKINLNVEKNAENDTKNEGKDKANKEENSGILNILEWIACIFIAIVLGLVIRYYIFTPTEVKSVSMENTLIQGQKLVLNRTIRISHSLPKKGEIITFEAPSVYELNQAQADESKVARYNDEPDTLGGKFVKNVLELGKTSYIKRVIALPGDHVKIEDGKVYVNDQELNEPYLKEGVITENIENGYLTDFTVPEDSVFAMGDNRAESHDCRAFGCIPLDKIEGTVAFRFWPANLFGKVK